MKQIEIQKLVTYQGLYTDKDGVEYPFIVDSDAIRWLDISPDFFDEDAEEIEKQVFIEYKSLKNSEK